MKQRITAAELKAMTMKELDAWVEFNACAINRTMVMAWGHEELFKGYHIRPEYIGWKAGRLIVKTFHFTSRTRKADAQSFAEWLHWAIFGEYPAEETEETEAETIEETAEAAQEAPAAEAEQQPTETENAPQAATQAAQDAATEPAPITAEMDKLRNLRDAIKADPANPGTIRAALDAITANAPDIDPTELDSPRAICAAITEIINTLYWDNEEEHTMSNPITAAIIDSMSAPAPVHTITVSWANGTRATYSADMLDMIRTDPAALDIQDDETGELIYIKPDDEEPADPAPAEDPAETETAEEPETITAMWQAIHEADAELQRVQDPAYIQAQVDAMTWHTPAVDWAARIDAAMKAAGM